MRNKERINKLTSSYIAKTSLTMEYITSECFVRNPFMLIGSSMAWVQVMRILLWRWRPEVTITRVCSTTDAAATRWAQRNTRVFIYLYGFSRAPTACLRHARLRVRDRVTGIFNVDIPKSMHLSGVDQRRRQSRIDVHHNCSKLAHDRELSRSKGVEQSHTRPPRTYQGKVDQVQSRREFLSSCRSCATLQTSSLKRAGSCSPFQQALREKVDQYCYVLWGLDPDHATRSR